MFFLLLCLTVLPYAFGGSECKPRSDIHPCICLDRPIGKSKFYTTVICHGLNDGSSILKIEPALADMQINTFLLYDSYWSNDLRRSVSDASVPVNFLSSFKMEEIKVVDSNMAFFACSKEYNCRTNYLKRFTSINSTLPERSPCANGFNINIWISCPGTVEHVIIEEGFKDLNLKTDFFPQAMMKLTELRMPRNGISRIERGTFSLATFPALETLDLSHNSLRDIRRIFTGTLKLKYLDLSFNTLKTFGEFQYLPNLEALILVQNHFTALVANDWLPTPSKLRLVDLRDNNIECNCGSEFLNSTFHINTDLRGHCGSSSYSLVQGKPLRRAARFFAERCDEQGNIMAKKSKAKPPK